MDEMGSLAGCILENDPESQNRARRLRNKSLAMSLTCEAVLLAAILILPLINPGVLGGKLAVTPMPPYNGGNSFDEKPRNSVHQSPAKTEVHQACLFCSHPVAPEQRQGADHDENDEHNDADEAPGLGLDPGGNGRGPVIPGADENGHLPVELNQPEPVQHLAPVRMSQGVMEAALIQKIQPEYPAPARLARISGIVNLRAVIGIDGRIRELEVISGNAFLQAAAVTAVRRWRYRPTLLNGVAVEVETLITVKFVLDQP